MDQPSTPLPDTRAARSAILGLLRGGTPPTPLPRPDLQPYRAGPYGRGSLGPRLDPATLVAGFEAAARAWRAEVRHAQPDDWPAVLKAELAARGCRHVAVGTSPRLQAGLAEALQGLKVSRFDRPLETWKAELFDEVDVGITDTLAGVADTGTLVLQPGPQEPRTLSLVPPLHVALLRASTLHASLPAAFLALAPEADMPANLLLVTGPSKTADIQQVLAYGAHGPKALVIIVVHDTPPAEGVQP